MQKYIQSVNAQAKGSAKQKGMLTPEEAATKKKAMKEAKKRQEDELAALFDEALLVGGKRGKAGAQAGEKGGTHVAVDGRIRKAQETVVVQEEEKTMEDLIEEQRAALAAQGKKGTPVTEESLAKWKADRKAKKRADERMLVERKVAEKGKKGLNVLSGRALYEYDSSIFKDDANAADKEELQQQRENCEEELQTGVSDTTAAGKTITAVQGEEVDVLKGVQKDVFLQDDDDVNDLDCLSDDGEV